MIKINRKSITAIALAFAMSVSFSGCKNKSDTTTDTLQYEQTAEPGSTETTTLEQDTTEAANSEENTISEDGATSEAPVISEDDATSEAPASTDSISDKTTEDATTTETSSDEPATPTMADPSSDNEENLSESEKFDIFLDEAFKESVVNDTITLHYTLSHPENYGITPPEVTFGSDDISEEGIEKDKAEQLANLEELEAFDYALLTKEQQFTYDVLHELSKTNLEFYDYIYLYEPFAYTSGLHSNLPITLSEYKLNDKGDVEDYLKLLELTPDYFQLYLDFEQVKVGKGLFMNTNSANEVIRQCNEFIATPEKNLLIETFNDNIEEVPGLTPEEIEGYKQANHDAVMTYVIPAYKKTIQFFTKNKSAGKNELGLAHLDGGTDYYKFLIKSKVGSDKTPEEIIELLDEKINTDMNKLTTSALTNYNAYVSYFDEYEGFYQDVEPKETIEYFEDVFKDKFPSIPDIDFTIEPVHESLVDIVSPAFFMQPQLDDYERNSIYTNLSSEGAGSLWSTLAHEGVPGHMYQFVYFLSSNPYPIRVIADFTGYAEGWATYAELMSFDYYDGYSDEVYADIERLNSELNLLVSARVEIGINYEGWTLEETEQYLTDSGFSAEAAKGLMDYVVAEPTNYQMYVLGWLEFCELREYAETELGENFDEVEFHKVLLDAGPCQFYLLRNLVEDYVAAK